MILMQLSSNVVPERITYLVGSANIISTMPDVPALPSFDEKVISFLNALSKALMGYREYSDVVTFAFWIRQANIKNLQERFKSDEFRLGRGMVFHIAPSNVPVNFAYSMVSALLCGNSNVVRVPSKDFPQVEIITNAITKTLEQHPELKRYIACVRYEHNKEINDLFSSICDVRIIWGGDKTIETLRQSPLQPRSTEITFADRYSIAVIDSDAYLAIEDKRRVAQNFYNDTFFSDQNACTSPRIIIWTGDQIQEAKEQFWQFEHTVVKEKYNFQPIQAVNKLTRAYLDAVAFNDLHIEPHEDNFIYRVKLESLLGLNLDNNSGYFYEYDCKHNLLEIKELCNSKKCQTSAYIGEKEMFTELLSCGIKGIDRIVPVGTTMDFDLVWDGYDLTHELSREITTL